MPLKPISADEVGEGEDKNIEEPVEVEDEDAGSPLLPLPVCFISI